MILPGNWLSDCVNAGFARYNNTIVSNIPIGCDMMFRFRSSMEGCNDRTGPASEKDLLDYADLLGVGTGGLLFALDRKIGMQWGLVLFIWLA